MSDMIPESGQGESVTEPIGNPAGGDSSGSLSESTTSQGSEPTGYNPAWDEAFSAIADVPEFHEKLKPVFKKWDESSNSRYEKVQQEIAPYRPLLENNVPFEDIQAAFELRNRLATEPKEIFEKLATHLGYDISSLVEANGDEESQGQNQYSEDEDDDPRITALRKELDAQKQFLQQQAQEQIAKDNALKQEQQEQEYYTKTVAELDRLESTYGKFDRNKAVQFAIWEAQTAGSDEINLEAGLKAMKEFQGQAIQSSANSKAPDVFSGNGSLASGRVDTSKMSEDEFQKFAVERMKAKLG